jgi:hypothetical protein
MRWQSRWRSTLYACSCRRINLTCTTASTTKFMRWQMPKSRQQSQVGSVRRGGALRGKLALLESVSAHVSKELTHHRDAFHDIGRRYQNIDDGSASEIIRARQNL